MDVAGVRTRLPAFLAPLADPLKTCAATGAGDPTCVLLRRLMRLARKLIAQNASRSQNADGAAPTAVATVRMPQAMCTAVNGTRRRAPHLTAGTASSTTRVAIASL